VRCDYYSAGRRLVRLQKRAIISPERFGRVIAESVDEYIKRLGIDEELELRGPLVEEGSRNND
jgi:hypothetical protein